MQKGSKDPIKYLWWDFLQKEVMVKRRLLFLQKNLSLIFERILNTLLREKCPHSEFFWSLVRIFPHSDRKRRDTEISLRIQFKCGKIRARKTLNTDTFQAVHLWHTLDTDYYSHVVLYLVYILTCRGSYQW